jgi:pimeloyl-ACP methyl ester carboxylesterase
MGNANFGKSGHPRTRGARSSFLDEPNHGGEIRVRFGTVQSFDGTPIFYCEEGEGPPLVFCYGIACSTLHWTYQIDYFRKNYRCIWFDYRGHQNTPIPAHPDSMSIEASARDLKAVLDFLGVEKADLLGHSMGVSVVLQFARTEPSRVNRLVLANGTPKKPLETLLGGNYLMPAFDLLSRYEKLKPEWIKGVWKLQEKGAASELFLGTLGFNRALCDPGDIKTYARQIAALPPKVLTRMMDDYQHFDATPWLHELPQSTLILSGEKDLVTPPETQDVLHQLMPNAELVRIRHGSHCSTLDLPEYVNLLIEKFLEQPPKIG